MSKDLINVRLCAVYGWETAPVHGISAYLRPSPACDGQAIALLLVKGEETVTIELNPHVLLRPSMFAPAPVVTFRIVDKQVEFKTEYAGTRLSAIVQTTQFYASFETRRSQPPPSKMVH